MPQNTLIWDEARGLFRWYFAAEPYVTRLPTHIGVREVAPQERRPDPWQMTPYAQYRDVLARCGEETVICRAV